MASSFWRLSQNLMADKIKNGLVFKTKNLTRVDCEIIRSQLILLAMWESSKKD